MLLILLLALPLSAAVPALLARHYYPALAAAAVWMAGLGFGLALVLARACISDGVVSVGPGEFLRADGLSAVLVLVITGVAFVSLWSGAGTLGRARDGGQLDGARVRHFYVLTNLFAFTMLLTVLANNVGVMWVALEATTIATAFLIGLQHSKAALEASWKYILIGSIGIALAFVGTVLGYFNFVQRVGQTDYALHWTVLARVAQHLDGDVLRLSFVFIVIGYGTKAGLAPMHTWLPDAHSEAPAPISAMMSGSLLAVALYAIARWKVVVDAGVGPDFSNRMLMLMGTLSVALAALLLIRQSSYKRMLAYSSVEHVGLICLGLGLGPLGTLAALLQMIGHAAGKSLLFLTSGRILETYGTTRIASVRGLLAVRPWTGGLFLLGGMALLGLPPFGLFVSELLLLRAGFRAGHPWLGGLLIVLLLVIFVFFLGHLNRMLYGLPPKQPERGEPHASGLWPLALNVAVLIVLGVVIPRPLLLLLQRAVEVLQP
jgi:hydrogenase-4 component F